MKEITSWDDDTWDEIEGGCIGIAYALTDFRGNRVYVGETSQSSKKKRLKEWFQSESPSGIILVNTSDIVEVQLWEVESERSKDAEAALYHRLNPPCSTPVSTADRTEVDLPKEPDYIFKVPTNQRRGDVSPHYRAQDTMIHISKILNMRQIKLATKTQGIEDPIAVSEATIEYYFDVAEAYALESIHEFDQ